MNTITAISILLLLFALRFLLLLPAEAACEACCDSDLFPSSPTSCGGSGGTV